MGETTNQIEAHIEQTRDNLGANIHELEQKVKSFADWKHHFQNSPMTMMGVAFGGGVLLATMTGGKKRRSPAISEQASHFAAGTGRHKYLGLEPWDNIKGALLGVAATRFKDFVDEIVPGFKEQFQRTQDGKTKIRESGALRVCAVKQASAPPTSSMPEHGRRCSQIHSQASPWGILIFRLTSGLDTAVRPERAWGKRIMPGRQDRGDSASIPAVRNSLIASFASSHCDSSRRGCKRLKCASKDGFVFHL
jgi:hypothetical protein